MHEEGTVSTNSVHTHTHMSASSSRPPLASAHIITSGATRAKRAGLISALEGSLGKVASTVHMSTDALDAEAIPEMLASWAGDTPVAELDPKKVPDAMMMQLSMPMHLRAISNAMKHREALLAIAKAYESGSGQRFALVVEDDALYAEEQMLDAVKRAVSNAPENADIIFLGLPSKRPIPSTPAADPRSAEFDDVIDLVSNQVLPACDSYLVSRSAADRIASGFLPIRFNTNVHWTFLVRTGVVRKAYIAVPNAFVDGSKLGVFTSSISTNNQLIWNQGYCQLMTMVMQGEFAGFEALWNQQTAMLQNHPDAQVLLGDYYGRVGRTEDAKVAYERALKAYEEDGCLVNNTSEFMKRYMSVFRS